MELSVIAYIEVILAGLKTSYTKENACETDHIGLSLKVVILTCEDTLNLVCSVECLSV